MASFYQRTTGRRQPTSGVHNEDKIHWPSVEDERSHRKNWSSESRHRSRTVDAGRARSRTMNSTMSFYATNSDSSSTPSPPMSPHLTRDRKISSLEKRENTARTLFSKGSRILRSHGSKFSLSSLNSDHGSDPYTGRPVNSHTASKDKDRHGTADGIKREELKRIISDPYDFQHHTHLDQKLLNSIKRVPKTELVGEFSALRAGQASMSTLKSIRAEDLPQRPVDSLPIPSVTKADIDIESSILQTPPRPTPPPKDNVATLSPAHPMRMSCSVDNLTPPRRYSSRRALQPSLISSISPLGAYVHSPSQSLDMRGIDSTEDLCDNCKGIDVVEDKPLPDLPQIHATTTNDDGTRYLHMAPPLHTPLDLDDVPEEDDIKRQSTAVSHLDAESVVISTSTDENSAVASNTGEAPVVREDNAILPSNRTFVIDEWDDAIDDSWDHAAEPETPETQCPSSMSAQVACFVDKAMTRLAGHERTEPLPVRQSEPTIPKTPAPRSPRVSTGLNELDTSVHDLVSTTGSDSSPLLGLGIELQQKSQDVLDPWSSSTATIMSTTPEVNNRDSSLTASFKSDFTGTSRLSKSSSQESVLWSIASSIMGTQRSSNSSNSLLVLDQLPDYPRAAKSVDDLKDALESVQEHLQEIHEEQLAPDSSLESHPAGKHSHQRARSLATDFVFGINSGGTQKEQAANSNDQSPRTSYGHGRESSGSRVPIPTRKSSVAARDQAELSRPPARRMRSATTIARSRQASRASYSLFPGI